jgi:hypothetical protein
MSTKILLLHSTPEKGKKNITVTPRKLYHLFLYNVYLGLCKDKHLTIHIRHKFMYKWLSSAGTDDNMLDVSLPRT